MNGRSPETIRAYRRDLEQALAEPGVASAVSDHDLSTALALWLNRLTHDGAAPRSVRRRLATLRTWGKFYERTLLTRYKAPDPGQPEPHPLPEGMEGVRRMIKSTRNPRHKALCALTGMMGLRVGEAVAVEPSHFNLTEMTLTVVGKGRKTRTVPVSEEAWRHLARAYALAIEKGWTLTRLTNHGARVAIARHGRNAGLSRHVRSHDMRATFATAAYKATHDLRAVQELLGHTDVKTTQVYTEASMDSRRKAVSRI